MENYEQNRQLKINFFLYKIVAFIWLVWDKLYKWILKAISSSDLKCLNTT